MVEMINEYRAIDELRICRGNRTTQAKLTPVLLGLIHLNWGRIQSVGD
jgi:hypothetical protein